MTTKVLITGASGLLGRAIYKVANDYGFNSNVLAFTRLVFNSFFFINLSQYYFFFFLLSIFAIQFFETNLSLLMIAVIIFFCRKKVHILLIYNI